MFNILNKNMNFFKELSTTSGFTIIFNTFLSLKTVLFYQLFYIVGRIENFWILLRIAFLFFFSFFIKYYINKYVQYIVWRRSAFFEFRNFMKYYTDTPQKSLILNVLRCPPAMAELAADLTNESNFALRTYATRTHSDTL